jgi:hypothetical protein
MNKRANDALLNLKSQDVEEVKKACDYLEENGTLAQLEEIFEIYLATENLDIKRDVFNLLASVSVKGAAEKWMEMLYNKDNAHARKQILHILWNSKLNYSDHIASFVKMACESDYLTALECLTILENLEGPFDEASLLEAQLHLRDYLESRNEEDDKKKFLMSEIALILKDQNEGVDTDLLLE